VGVHVGSGGDVRRGDADGLAVLDHRLAYGDVPESNLVAERDRLAQGEPGVAYRGDGPGGQCPQGHGHGVRWMQAVQFHVPYSISSGANCWWNWM